MIPSSVGAPTDPPYLTPLLTLHDSRFRPVGSSGGRSWLPTTAGRIWHQEHTIQQQYPDLYFKPFESHAIFASYAIYIAIYAIRVMTIKSTWST